MLRLLLMFSILITLLGIPKNAFAVVLNSKHPPQYFALKNRDFSKKKLYKQPFSENDTVGKPNPLVKSVGVVTFLGLAGLGLAVVTSSFAVFFLSLLLTMGAILFGLIVLIVVLSKKGNKTSSVIKLLRNIALGILGFILIGRWAQRAFD